MPMTLALIGAHALVLAASASVARLVLAFGVAVAIAIPLGVLLTRPGRFTATVGGLLLGLQTLPSVIWASPVLLLLGDGEPSILLATLLGSVFAMTLIVRDAIRGIPASCRVVGHMLGARRWKLLRFVLLPASLPGLTSGVRSGFAFVWRSLLGAEMVIGIARVGLGASLGSARRIDDLPSVLVSIAVMVLVAILVDRCLFAPLERAVHYRFSLADGK